MDYYSLPNTKEPFEGKVIKLDSAAFDYLFQNYASTSEYEFREKLQRYDEWLSDKPYKVYNNWVNHIVKWLNKKEQYG
jgi:hypothetical protein